MATSFKLDSKKIARSSVPNEFRRGRITNAEDDELLLQAIARQTHSNTLQNMGLGPSQTFTFDDLRQMQNLPKEKYPNLARIPIDHIQYLQKHQLQEGIKKELEQLNVPKSIVSVPKKDPDSPRRNNKLKFANTSQQLPFNPEDSPREVSESSDEAVDTKEHSYPGKQYH